MKFLRNLALLLLTALLLILELGGGTQYRPVANPILSNGGQPQKLFSAYVVNYNPLGSGSNLKIDVSGDTNVQVLTMGAGSFSEIFLGGVGGALFIANRD